MSFGRINCQSIFPLLIKSSIAKNKTLKIEELLEEMETIVASGTKLNLDYAIEDFVPGVFQAITFTSWTCGYLLLMHCPP